MTQPASAPLATPALPSAIFPGSTSPLAATGPELDSAGACDATARRLRGCCLLWRLLAGAMAALCLSAGGAPGLAAEAAVPLASATAASLSWPGATALQTLAVLAALVAITTGRPGIGGHMPFGRRSPASVASSCSSHWGDGDPV